MRTYAGRDLQARQLGDHSSNATGVYASAHFLAVSEDPTAPAKADTTLAGEIASGTLARAAGTFAHTNGSAFYTVTRTLTADGEVTLKKYALFNAASSGTMAFETALDNEVTLYSGDSVQITAAVDLGA